MTSTALAVTALAVTALAVTAAACQAAAARAAIAATKRREQGRRKAMELSAILLNCWPKRRLATHRPWHKSESSCIRQQVKLGSKNPIGIPHSVDADAHQRQALATTMS